MPKSTKFHTVLGVCDRRGAIFKALSSDVVTLKITKVPKVTARVLATLTILIKFISLGKNQMYCAHAILPTSNYGY